MAQKSLVTLNRSLIVVLALILAISIQSLLKQNNDLKNQINTNNQQQIRDQLQQGMSCGLMTLKEARTMLGQEAILDGASIISRSSPSVDSRPGSPRVDACSYVLPATNGTYLDVVIKMYNTSSDAQKYFSEETNKVVFITDKQVDSSSNIQQLRYTAGVHYALIDTMSIQVSASKIGAVYGKSLEDFSRQVLDFIVVKL